MDADQNGQGALNAQTQADAEAALQATLEATHRTFLDEREATRARLEAEWKEKSRGE